jgi:hypothetical protein
MPLPHPKALTAFLLATAWVASAAEAEPSPKESLVYAGNYRVSGDRTIGIDPFIMDDGTSALLIADYTSGDRICDGCRIQ